MGVYGWSTTSDKWRTWDLLRSVVKNTNLPTVMGGDFNEIISQDEKEGGSTMEPRNFRGYKEVIHDLALRDLGFVGPRFTWERDRCNDTAVRERLDRFLCTEEWG